MKLWRSPIVVVWRLDDDPYAKQPCHDYSTGAGIAQGRPWPPPAPLDSLRLERPAPIVPYTWIFAFGVPCLSGSPYKPADSENPSSRISQFRRAACAWRPPKVPRNICVESDVSSGLLKRVTIKRANHALFLHEIPVARTNSRRVSQHSWPCHVPKGSVEPLAGAEVAL
jgi:hypothetical protein